MLTHPTECPITDSLGSILADVTQSALLARTHYLGTPRAADEDNNEAEAVEIYSGRMEIWCYTGQVGSAVAIVYILSDRA